MVWNLIGSMALALFMGYIMIGFSILLWKFEEWERIKEGFENKSVAMVLGILLWWKVLQITKKEKIIRMIMHGTPEWW